MKKYWYVVVLTLLAIVFFAGVGPVLAQTVEPCNPLDPSCVVVHDTSPLTVDNFPLLTMLIVGGVTFFVTLGVQSLSKAFGVDISGKATALTGALVLTVIEFIDKILATVPSDLVPVVAAGIGFVLSILTAYGYAGLLKKTTTTPTAPEKAAPIQLGK